MGQWVHSETVSFGDYVAAALERGAAPGGWQSTPRDVSLFRGCELVRCLCLAQLTGGTVAAVQRTESNPFPVLTLNVGDTPADPQRAAAARVLARSAVLYSGGQVDDSDIQTTSEGGDTQAWPIVVGVTVVALGGLAFTGYCVHRSLQVFDAAKQREADFAKLKELDAQQLALVKQHADREIQAGKPLPLDEATRAALAGAARAQEVIAEKQTSGSSNNPGGFFDAISPTQIAIGAALALGALVLLKK
jgi:hypothetical protein